MNAIHHTKNFSAANVLTTGSALLLYGPIPVDHLDNFALHFVNSGTATLYYTLKTSYDEGRNFEDEFPLGSFTNSAAIAALPGQTVVRSLYGHANPFRYITILASCTAVSFGTSQSCLKISGRSSK